MELTPWFDHTVKPVRSGWYDVEVTAESPVKPLRDQCMWFNGSFWFRSLKSGCGEDGPIILTRGDKWRGRLHANRKEQ